MQISKMTPKSDSKVWALSCSKPAVFSNATLCAKCRMPIKKCCDLSYWAQQINAKFEEKVKESKFFKEVLQRLDQLENEDVFMKINEREK